MNEIIRVPRKLKKKIKKSEFGGIKGRVSKIDLGMGLLLYKLKQYPIKFGFETASSKHIEWNKLVVPLKYGCDEMIKRIESCESEKRFNKRLKLLRKSAGYKKHFK